MISTDEYAAATAQMGELRSNTPHAVAARYDRKADRVVLTLSSKVELMFSPKDAQGLEDATPIQLSTIEITPSGFGIHFPKLDADLYVPALLEGFLGSRKWMASRLGAQGGKSRSTGKVAAARANGALGGRPRKVATR
ncbi:DUF2442 domain-containing protein [Granulicella aggregans]|uniref:DUF2442 domain-containing protein n=1 Tax=Granulicella aggregans TaxID=474949 RepID=UPI0021DF69E4|nr:DUF2442 domain-containing protein [Granulicella aggregans]